MIKRLGVLLLRQSHLDEGARTYESMEARTPLRLDRPDSRLGSRTFLCHRVRQEEVQLDIVIVADNGILFRPGEVCSLQSGVSPAVAHGTLFKRWLVGHPIYCW